MKKIALVTNGVPFYRRALFERIANHVDLTVIHSGAACENYKAYKTIAIKSIGLGPFRIQPQLLKMRLHQYDCVIFMCDIRWITSVLSFLFVRKKTRTIWWGAWVTGRQVIDRVRVMLLSKSDANIFYCKRHLLEFQNIGLAGNANYVANNTLDVSNAIDTSSKEKGRHIVCVGSLNYRKRLDLVIEAVSELKSKGIEYQLTLVGTGPMEKELKDITESKGLNQCVEFLGSITDHNELKSLFSRSVMSISPGQAGLSVLQSMAFGVPFVTSIDAISGGEKDNIVNGENGILIDSISIGSICSVLEKHYRREVSFNILGANAYQTYKETATIDLMANVFISAINGVPVKEPYSR